MIFQGSALDFQLEHQSKIDDKTPSKTECLNLCPFTYENQAQDAPKTPQDAPKTLQGASKSQYIKGTSLQHQQIKKLTAKRGGGIAALLRVG